MPNKVESKKEEHFTNKEIYNPLYVSPNPDSEDYIPYTQPSGDVNSQKVANSGQGTSGGFLPLQGNGAQIMMKNSAPNNRMIPSKQSGEVGGNYNYTDKKFTTFLNGFNNFVGFDKQTKGYSNSYLIRGNQRVENAGQKGDFPCDKWWPTLSKDSQGFCTTGNTLTNLTKFIDYKSKPQWVKTVL